MTAIILGNTFPGCSTTSFFAVYLVASFKDVISNPFSSSLNDRSSIALKFRILWGIAATGYIFSCGGELSFSVYQGMILHCLSADFSFDYFLNATLSYSVLADGWGPLFNAATISVFVLARPQLNSRPYVSYCTRRGTNGCYNALLLGSICHLKSTDNAASNFVPLYPVSVFLFCTCQNVFLQKSVYISVIGIF